MNGIIIQSTPSTIDTIGALGPVIIGVLTFFAYVALVILYRKQQKQLEAQHKAILIIEQADWNGDELSVELANYGNGVAENIHLITLVYSDNELHREYSLNPTLLQRPGSQSWTTSLPPNGDSVTLKAESKLGMPIFANHPRNWTGISFSNFLNRIKSRGSTELKFIHLIRAYDLAGNVIYRDVYPEMRITDPQQYTQGDSIESLTTLTQTSKDGTFRNFFARSRISTISHYLYEWGFGLLNRIPFIALGYRPLDASGTKRVKRIFLRRFLQDAQNRVRNRVSSWWPRNPNNTLTSNVDRWVTGVLSDVRSYTPSRAHLTLGTVFLFMVFFTTQQLIVSRTTATGPKVLLENTTGIWKYLAWFVLPIAHSSAEHLFGNMLFFIPLAYALEQRLSLGKFWIFIYSAGLFANVVFPMILFISGLSVALAIGASSITHALVSRESVYRFHKLATEDSVLRRDWAIFILVALLLAWNALKIYYGVTPEGASVPAHLGGLLFGAIIGVSEIFDR